jgi:hypothetical protein
VNKRRKGGGPKSAAGKAIASRNALRHGFAATFHRRPPAPERIERLAQAIAGDDKDPAVVAQAGKIAENEILLGEIAAHKVWVVERLREACANPFAAKNNSLQLETARARQAWLAEREIKARLPALLEKYEAQLIDEHWVAERKARYAANVERELQSLFSGDQLAALVEEKADKFISDLLSDLRASGWRMASDDIVPIRLKALLEKPEDESAKNGAVNDPGDEDRDEYEALEAALRDLVRLDRYERRAWSRQKRAIWDLAKIKLQGRWRQDTSHALG